MEPFVAMVMNSRDAVLQSIRSGLANAAEAGFAHLEPPPVHEVWPRTNPDRETLAKRFAEELKAVHGETIRCASVAEAGQKLASIIQEAGWSRIAAVDRPLAHEVTAALPADKVAWTQDNWQPREMAELPAGLVTADYLLADTGTSVIACRTAPERLLCYLPPACVVVAKADQLHEHLPAAWPEIARRAADRELTGEFVMVTGPSRTADIEKILILGVHGPKRLVVLLVG
jgi:L-lactate dehydrogenase complex protein LldG